MTTAEEAADRLADGLAEDVPQRDVDAADRVGHGAARPCQKVLRCSLSDTRSGSSAFSHDPLRDEWRRATPARAVTVLPRRPKTVRDGSILAYIGGGLIALPGLLLAVVASDTSLFRSGGRDLAPLFGTSGLSMRNRCGPRSS